MLLDAPTLRGIEAGCISVAFRSWRRPTVKAGGTLLTPSGLLRIDAVDTIDPADISDADARASGAPDADAVRAGLRAGPDRTAYRIAFHRDGDDPRITLRRRTDLSDDEWATLRRQLDSLDTRSPTGPWTTDVLMAIADRPATVAATLAAGLDQERAPFKLRVRRLKALGLTESLEVGYRLSPLGTAAIVRFELSD